MALIKITNCVLMAAQSLSYSIIIVSDIAIFVLKRDVKLQPTNSIIQQHLAP